MSFRAVVLGILCIALLASAALGLHQHVLEPDDHHHGAAAHVTAEGSAVHEHEHADHGAVDIDPAQGPASEVPQPWLLAGLVWFALWAAAFRVPIRRLPAPGRADVPLRPPRTNHHLPPSHAPPLPGH